MALKTTPLAFSPFAILFVALALSIGWGVRGNWGHEYGAMIPGALAAMAAVLVSKRDDWHRRIPFFAFFGAVGWSFGGSISYMQVIAYTHSGHALSVAYGFACLFLIGFIWVAIGGAGTALPAFLDRNRLTELLVPTAAVFAAWLVQDFLVYGYFNRLRVQVREGLLAREQMIDKIRWLNWHDTDWIAALVAAGAVVLVVIARRRVCWGSSLVLHMCAGWWLGFLLLTVTLGLRMTPPRGDNWAGALGMTIGLFVFLIRQREFGITWAALVTGLFGGLGFSGATLIKLVLVNPDFQQLVFRAEVETNWHSILEQTFGFISGVGVAVVMGFIGLWSPRQSEQPNVRRWAEPVAVGFVMLVITYVNIVKNLDAVWLKNGTVPELLLGRPSVVVFNLAYAMLAITIILPLSAYYHGERVSVLPSSRLGKGQLFFIMFLWWIVIGNLRTVPFAPQRLMTEGVIHFNACLCTVLAIFLPERKREIVPIAAPNYGVLMRKTAVAGVIATALVIAGQFGLVRAMWGDTFVGHGGKHIRFGPDATLDKK